MVISKEYHYILITLTFEQFYDMNDMHDFAYPEKEDSKVEAYSEPCQTCEMEFLAKMVNLLGEKLHLRCLQGFPYTSAKML